jgi:hypothetical protein
MSGSRSRIFWLLVTTIGVFSAARQSFAFCLGPQLRVSDEYYVSPLVLTGTVIGQKLEVAPDDPDGSTGTFYKVHVDKTWRGTPQQTITLYSENSTARFPMQQHKAYVLFVTRSPEGKWVVDNCGNSNQLPSADKTLAALRHLPLKQSFVYGEVYVYGQSSSASCPPMEVTITNAQQTHKTVVKLDCTFSLPVPPGSYRAEVTRKGVPIAVNDLSYKDPYCFEVPQGGSAGIAFRTAVHPDAEYQAMISHDNRIYRELCTKQKQVHEPAGDFVLSQP